MFWLLLGEGSGSKGSRLAFHKTPVILLLASEQKSLTYIRGSGWGIFFLSCGLFHSTSGSDQ